MKQVQWYVSVGVGACSTDINSFPSRVASREVIKKARLCRVQELLTLRADARLTICWLKDKLTGQFGASERKKEGQSNNKCITNTRV